MTYEQQLGFEADVFHVPSFMHVLLRLENHEPHRSIERQIQKDSAPRSVIVLNIPAPCGGTGHMHVLLARELHFFSWSTKLHHESTSTRFLQPSNTSRCPEIVLEATPSSSPVSEEVD